jgi:hypothetical protein
MMPQSPESKKITETAHALIAQFGRNAGVEAHEGAAAARADGDLDGEAFYLAVVRRIEEFYGQKPLTTGP